MFTYDAARAALEPILAKVWRAIENGPVRGRTVTLKVKYADFRQITRARTCEAPVLSLQQFEEAAFSLLRPVFPVEKGIRLLGVSLSSLSAEEDQAQAQLHFDI